MRNLSIKLCTCTLLLGSCTSRHMAINTTVPNPNQYIMVAKNSSSNNYINYVYYLDELKGEGKIMSYKLRDTLSTKVFNIVFSRTDTIKVTSLLKLKENQLKKTVINKELIFIAMKENRFDTVFYKINNKTIKDNFLSNSEKNFFSSFRFYPFK